jgi:transcriptional regulator with XRE-family HTH domain
MRGPAMTEHEHELLALGQAIRHERHAKGLSIASLASKAGVSPKSLNRVELGQGGPTWNTLSAIASALGISVLLRPDQDAILARHGERRLTPEEFEKHLGHLPTDGEG